MRPRNDYVFIKVLEDTDNETSGGIIVAGKTDLIVCRATVENVGPGVDDLTEGDTVIVNEMATIRIDRHDQAIRLVTQEAIIGVVDE